MSPKGNTPIASKMLPNYRIEFLRTHSAQIQEPFTTLCVFVVVGEFAVIKKFRVQFLGKMCRRPCTAAGGVYNIFCVLCFSFHIVANVEFNLINEIASVEGISVFS